MGETPWRFESSQPHDDRRSSWMRSVGEVAAVLALRDAGHSATAIARITGIPRGTVSDWVNGHVPGGALPTGSPWTRPDPERADFLALPSGYAYRLGLYLGDGCLSAHPRGVFRLRIFLDLRYPGIVDECESAIRDVLPGTSVARLERGGSFARAGAPPSNVQVSAYSKCLPSLFPQHGPGRKHERAIKLVDWQEELVRRHPELLLRGPDSFGRVPFHEHGPGMALSALLVLEPVGRHPGDLRAGM
jgi:hypothetical protein